MPVNTVMTTREKIEQYASVKATVVANEVFKEAERVIQNTRADAELREFVSNEEKKQITMEETVQILKLKEKGKRRPAARF